MTAYKATNSKKPFSFCFSIVQLVDLEKIEIQVFLLLKSVTAEKLNERFCTKSLFQLQQMALSRKNKIERSAEKDTC